MFRAVNLFKDKYLSFSPVVHFVLKLVISYLLMLGMYECYRGLSIPGGSFYWPMLEKYGPIRWMAEGLAYLVALTVQKVGHNVVIDGPLLRLDSGAGVIIVPGCLGLKIMFCWIAFIFAFPSSKNKTPFILLGLVLIQIINIGRISALLLSYQYQKDLFMDHHDLFNILAYIAVGAMLLVWVRGIGKVPSL
ncbi:archaeosortase/exosortase family protein [Cytophagaceae bacterium ABcell3]|nr:archaeosortase/exosortase family protein [Cytophagaceae bacterium ABcell3]